MPRELKLETNICFEDSFFGERHLADGLKNEPDSLGLRVDRVVKEKSNILNCFSRKRVRMKGRKPCREKRFKKIPLN